MNFTLARQIRSLLLSVPVMRFVRLHRFGAQLLQYTRSMRLGVIWAFLVIEALIAFLLLSRSDGELLSSVTFADTKDYVEPALRMLRGGAPWPTRRTLGYPLFLAACELLVPGKNLLATTVVVQLALNLVFISMAIALVRSVVPDCARWAEAMACTYVGVAGLDQALRILSDFLAAFLFLASFVFIVVRRGIWGYLGTAVCLGAATLVRPSFTAFPIVLVPMAVLLAKMGRSGRWAEWLAVAIACASATTCSCYVQHRSSGYVGPSDVVTQNIQALRNDADGVRVLPWRGVALNVDPNEAERAAKTELLADVRARPTRYAKVLGMRLAKYVLSPLEGTVRTIVRSLGGSWSPRGPLRIPLALAVLPYLALAAIRPPRSNESQTGGAAFPYCILAWLCFFYFIVLGLTAPDQGERMRLPGFPLLAPLAAANGTLWQRWLKGVRANRKPCHIFVGLELSRRRRA